MGFRLFGTALSSSVEPERVFARIAEGPVAPALGFAIWAESVALGSFAVLAALGLHLWDSELTWRIASDPFVAFLLALALPIGVLVMVLLHALWGIGLDLSARVSGAPRRSGGVKSGLRFGLYACGWDLLTSPAGLGHGLLSRRALEAWVPVYRAICAPRVAMRAYLERSHGLDARAQDRVARLSVWVLGGTTLLLCVALGIGMLRFVDEFVWG